MDYEQFRLEYEKQHPASIPIKPKDIKSEYHWSIQFIVLTMFVAAALMSGVHTVPTVHAGIEANGVISPLVRDIVSVASFVAIELAFFVTAYARIHGRSWTVIIMLITTFVIALVSNVSSVLRAMSANGDVGATVVGIVSGIGFPVVALAAGEFFVRIYTSNTKSETDAQKNYRDECKKLDASILGEWRKYQKDHPVQFIQSIHSVNSLGQMNEPREDGYSANSANGYSKRMDARAVIHEWFLAHPERMSDKLDDLLKAIEEDCGIKVGRTSIHNVRKEMMINGSHE